MKVALLDFDGTLFYTKDAIQHCLLETLTHFGYASVDSVLIDDIVNQGLTLEESLKSITNTIKLDNPPSINDMVTYYRAMYNGEIGLQKTKIYPNVLETLKVLQQNSILLIVVSNKGQVAIENTLKFFNIKEYIAQVVGSVPGIKSKPDPMIFIDIIKPSLLDVTIDEIIVVGDTVQDLIFAKNIGVQSCWARYGYGVAAHCMVHNPNYIIDNFSDLLSILRNDETYERAYQV
jgi:phosphoglycolate phosphatase